MPAAPDTAPGIVPDVATGSGAAIFGCTGTELSADERAFFRGADPFGFILFARNVETPDQLRLLTADLRESVGRDAPILVDQEGGRVQRLRAPHWRDWPDALDEVARLRAGGFAAVERGMELRYRLIAEELRAVGIDANCAPVADLLTEATHPFLRGRTYAGTVEDVAAIGRAVARGHLAAGVLPVVKHMPGHGRANADTHKSLPRVETDAATLRATDFAAFAALADLPMGMTAHIIFTAFDPDRPATCSPVMTGLIRDEIGFQGLLMSDDLAMEALSGTIPERAAAAIAGGCDVALHCNGTLAEREAVAAAVGAMSDAARARAAAALAFRQPPEPVDIAALEAEHSALLDERDHV